MRKPLLLILLTLPSLSVCAADADRAAAQRLQAGFRETVDPFVQTYCVSCHKHDKPKGDLDLSVYQTLDAVAADPRRWQTVLERLQAGEMPPDKAKLHPPQELSGRVIEWLGSLRKYEAQRNAGDPGPVYARRLSATEYDYTIRDLTGVDIHPAKEFPVDPANEAGFDNSAESLAMTPSLAKKYLEAARRVSEHLVLEPDGFEFAPYPIVADTDRDKFCVNRIIAFYKRQRTDYADYFLAAWRYRNRAAMGRQTATLTDIAADAGLSAKYLETIWSILTGPREDVGPVAALQARWQSLPTDEASAKTACARMRDDVVRLRSALVPVVKNLTAPRVHNGSQSLVLWKDRQMAANRRRYAGGAIRAILGAPDWTGVPAVVESCLDPAATRSLDQAFERFCSTFPDAFYVSERARVYLDDKSEKKLTGRLLSAGFHSQMGYFRDDGPLYDLMLTQDQQRELDEYWRELDFIASAVFRQYTGFIWFDRTDSMFMRDREFDFARAEDKDCTSETKIRRLEQVYLDKAIHLGAGDTAQQAIRDYFDHISATVRQVEHDRAAAEPKHLQALQSFAQRAYRRPLTAAERDGLVAFYHSLRDSDGLTHEEAMRDAITSVLMSPNFCYRLDLPRTSVAAGGTVQPLDDSALASRLSYFLWSSMPDQPLLDLAAAGQLHRPDVLIAQARRMLKDARARGLATAFAGNWLDFRRFEQHNGVDRQRFPTFTNDLRQAMFEEPIRFFLDVAQNDRPILDFLYADDTLVNPVLARHYGMPIGVDVKPDQWVRIDHAGQYGRGGLLPMAAFLTANSPGLRTSPVKRGNWVVKRLLGERIPPPPAKVPELPGDEAKLGNLTLRETLARHRADPSCAGCHEKFDAMGLVFEGFGPVGERRTNDLGGHAIDDHASFPGGLDGAGLDGLKTYIRQRRQNDFVDHFCRELLAFGLGRSLLPSDDATIDAMRSRLAGDGYRFGGMIEAIVTSPQFVNKRAGASVATREGVTTP